MNQQEILEDIRRSMARMDAALTSMEKSIPEFQRKYFEITKTRSLKEKSNVATY